MKRIVRDLAGILLLGDGIVGVLIPTRHTRRYERGPGPWRRAMRYFASRPALTRAAAIAEIVAGLRLGMTRS